ncbi:MAG: hypothetical protein AB1Z57_01730 [Acidimicrobiia bacterium]
MRTTGQRLDEHQAAIQRMLHWWAQLLPALAAMEERVDRLAAEVAANGGDPALAEEVRTLRELLSTAAEDVRRLNASRSQ